MNNTSNAIKIPADVASHAVTQYVENYKAITRGHDRLLLFSCDQKLEHLNKYFYGPGIDPADNDPEHMFKIAHYGNLGAFATHLGLIAQYGKDYPDIKYIVKMNGKTDLVKTEYRDPVSKQLWTIDQIVQFKKNSGLAIVGVGYTVYLGSIYEGDMLTQAAHLIYEAHQHGLLAIVWMYPRGKNVPEEHSGEIIADAAGVAGLLGADFAKINAPLPSHLTTVEWLAIASQAAGRTKLLVSGGNRIDVNTFLHNVYLYTHQGNIHGCAVGRNLHQRSLEHAIEFAHAMNAIVYENNPIV